MHLPTSLTGFLSRITRTVRPYRSVILIAVIGAVVIILYVRASSAALGPKAPPPDTQSAINLRRSCSSENTIFEDIKNLDRLVEIFEEEASAITDERMKILQTPSEWKCPKTGTDPADPAMPKLTSLAARLPGWSYEYPSPLGIGTTTLLRPVTFASFSSIFSELGREYECRLSELQDQALPIILRNEDLPSGAQYCCTGDSCSLVGPGVLCTGPTSPDPLCDTQCSESTNIMSIVSRLDPYYARTAKERVRARVAIERTIQALRSYDLNYAHARDLMCYARASMDLRAELSLLADTTSCLPKIWDAVTSIHDRAQP